MSQIVTPPDIVIEHKVYLIVNSTFWDFEMMVYWLKLSQTKYSIHIYNDNMSNTDWLNSVAKQAELILVDKTKSNEQTIRAISNYRTKIVWFGEEQKFVTATAYLTTHDRTVKNPTGIL